MRIRGFFLSRGERAEEPDDIAIDFLDRGAGFAVECERCSALVIDAAKHARICQ